MDPKTPIERKLQRMYGPSPEARAQLAKQQEGFDDWRGRCRKCGAQLEGPLSKLRAHSCGK